MEIDEAIKHAEEVAEEQDKLCKQYDDASRYARSHNKDIVSANAKKCLECFECANEHRQLAEWLKDYKRLKEQEPCEDCVSRKALIERINHAEENFKADNMESIGSDDGDPFVDGVLSGVFNIREMVIQAPSVTPQEPFKPMVEIDLYSVIKQKYIEREVFNKIRAEIEEHVKINQNLNTERAKALCWCLDVIDKYKAESEET